MLLTIAIPSLNGEKHIFETLMSAWLQVREHRAEVEIVVVDNCSQDKNLSELSRAKQEGVEFRQIVNPATIPADDNILEAIRQSQSEYVWVIADDDLLLPLGLDRVLEGLRANADVILANFTPFEDAEWSQYSLEEKLFGLRHSPTGEGGVFNHTIWLRGSKALEESGFSGFGLLSSMCVRRDDYILLAENARETIPQGFKWMFRFLALMGAGKTIRINDPVVGFRQYPRRYSRGRGHVESMTFDFDVHPRIMTKLYSHGYPLGLVLKMLIVRALTFPSHVLIARGQSDAFDMEFVRALLSHPIANPIGPFIAPLLIAPTWLLRAWVRALRLSKGLRK